MVLCDLSDVDLALIRVYSELRALLIPFVVIKSCVIALLQEDFHFTSSFMD